MFVKKQGVPVHKPGAKRCVLSVSLFLCVCVHVANLTYPCLPPKEEMSQDTKPHMKLTSASARDKMTQH